MSNQVKKLGFGKRGLRGEICARLHSFIHVQSVENVGTRKKRKENMRKAIDVETKKRKNIENV